jgi:hypothetical protein
MNTWVRAVAMVGAVGAVAIAAPPCHAEGNAARCVGFNDQGLKLRDARRLREAREQFLQCSVSACPGVIRKECERQVKELTAATPTVVFEAKNAAGDDLTAVVVTMDDHPLVDHLEGLAIPLDPGVHTFTFRGADHVSAEKKLVLAEGEKDRRVHVVLEAPAPKTASAPEAAAPPPPADAAPAPAAPPPGSASTAADTATPVAAASSGSSSWSQQKTIALLAAGVGVGAAVVGVAFGAATDSAWSRSQSECSTSTNCPNHTAAVNDRNSAGSDATIALISFATAIVGVGAGTVLWFTAPHTPSSEQTTTASVRLVPVAGPGAGALMLRGEF